MLKINLDRNKRQSAQKKKKHRHDTQKMKSLQDSKEREEITKSISPFQCN